ncbi:toprim domain-containing protein [Rhodohalobacter sp. 614A]|uniref:toprim domain-containing protein n=1 Tax=Rhodohalobacter sp. 614A TaxID=2908649 RepID=UPI001F18907F|nr:toprim domain-containing protein [Rhodohalobacter sp. 614A]
MDTSVYTLLIVESPTIAGIIQKMCPPSVYVISTDGFCWRPRYDVHEHQIKAIADPDKLPIRNELKEQAKIAGTIVIAVDSDASGDFIAWSVNRFIQSSNIKRGQLQSLSKKSIYTMLSETTELDEAHLEARLKNQFLIQKLWSKYAEIPDMQLAGLISILGANTHFHSFLDENHSLYRSNKPVQSHFDEWINLRPAQNHDQFRVQKPLSTFDVLEFIQSEKLSPTFHDGQLLLNQLFQTVLPFSEESLISYPRTSAQAFYSDTWAHMRQQYLNIGSVNHLKPTYLQEIADNEDPHESIHPIDLSIEPDSVAGELPKNIGKLYRWIYNQTLESLSMPKLLEKSLISDLNPDVIFYPDSDNIFNSIQSIYPCLTLSELGIKMNELGIAKSSKFGKTVDEWISKGWIHLNNRTVTPGKKVVKYLDEANSLHKKLLEVNRLKENRTLKPETVKEIITS